MALTVGELYVKLDLDSKAFTTQLEKARALLQGMVSKAQKLKLQVDSKDLAAVKNELSRTRFAIQVDTSMIDRATNSIRGAVNEANNARGAFGGLGQAINGAFSVAGGIILAKTLQEIGQAIGSIVPMAASFEQGMANIKAVLNPTTEDFQALTDKARELGRTTQFTATESAAAIEMLAKNGLSATQILNGAADATLAFASAAGTDLSTAADVATDAMLAFGLSASDLNTVVNQAVGAMNASKFGVDDYRLALGQAAGAAGSLGVSLIDFNTVIAATSFNFGSGSDAGTSFKTFLLRLTPTTKEATERMKQLGIITEDGSNRFYDAQGNLLPFIEILKVLRETMGDLSESELGAAGKDIFGQDAIRTLTGLLRTTESQYTALQERIANTDAADSAAARMDTFNGAIKILQSSLESAAISLGNGFLPWLTQLVQDVTAGVNVLDSIIQAVQGSESAFASLTPTMQAVVLAIQDVIAFLSALVNDLTGVFSDAFNTISDFFMSLASAAFGWGSDAGNQFANGISGSIDSVISSISAIGAELSYWLAPGSPPRVAPNIDKWGKEAAEVYMDGFSEADFSAVSDFSSNIRKALENVQGIDELDILSGTAQSTDMFKSVIRELQSFGYVAETTFINIVNSTGHANQEIAQLVSSTVMLEQANYDLAKAQSKVETAQSKLNAVQKEYEDSVRGIQAELDKLRTKDRIADIDSEIAEQERLANAFGGTGEIQAEAQRKIKELLLERQIAEKELEFADRIAAAEAEVEQAKDAVDIAKEQQAAAKAQYDLVLAQINAQKEANDLIREQIKLMEDAAKKDEKKSGGGGGGGGSAVAVDKDKEAQDRYNYSLLDTAGKLQNLRDKLSTVKEGSAEYYNILGQIGTLEKQQAKEQEQAAKQAEKENEDRLKAERDYKYSIADTKGKLAILRGELANVAVGSKEYYDILGQIATLEKQDAKKGGGAGGDILRNEERAKKEKEAAEKRLADQQQKFADQKLAAEQARMEKEKAASDQAAARARVNAILAPFQQMGAQINTFVSSAFSQLMIISGPFLAQFQGFISNSLAAITGFWEAHGTNITTSLSTTWNTLVTIITTIAEIILTGLSVFFAGLNSAFEANKETIFNTWNAAWNLLIGIINGALSVISSILNAVLAAMQGRWGDMWANLIGALNAAVITIGNAIINFLAVIVAAFGLNLGTILTDWGTWLTDTGSALTEWIGKTLEDIGKWFTDVLAAFTTWFGTVKEDWDKFWSEVALGASTVTGNILTDLGTWFTNVGDGFAEVVRVVTEKWAELAKLGEDLSGWLNGALSAVTGLVESFSNAAKGLGSAIIEGIKSGINSGLEGLKDAARSVAESAISAAKSVLRINSPSRVMMDIGQDYTEGFIQGVDMDSAGISKIGTTLARSIPSMESSMSSVSETVFQFNIDARGSTMNETQFRTIIRDEVNTLSRKGNLRGR